MSVEVATTKTLLWSLGGLVAVVKGLIVYIWWKNDDKQKIQDVEIRNLKLNLTTNYYDKEKIDFMMLPLQDAIHDNTEATKDLRNAVHELAISIARKNFD